jgi:hypothetical protein
MPANRHIVDQLAETRAEIRTLETREAEPRSRLLRDGSDLVGDDYVAAINTQNRSRLDTKAVRAHFGAEALAPFTVASKVTYVVIRAKGSRRP